MKKFAISIPKPCHEDWNKMTPDAKGAFCGSCQKSVYDFSNKTDEEIISVFEKEEKGKVCGRFSPSQLSRPVISFGNQSITSRLAIFAYSLLMVFGAALFNGAHVYGQGIKGEMKVKMVGKVSVMPLEEVKESAKDKVTQIKPVGCGSTIVRDSEMLTLGQAIVTEPIKIMGDTMFQETTLPVPVDTVVIEEELVNTVVPIEPEPISYIAGGVSYVELLVEPIAEINSINDTTEVDSVLITEAINSPVEDTTDKRSAIDTESIITPPIELEVKVSPNPSNGQITLSYNLENTSPVRIDLFDVTGKMVRILSNQGKQYAGKYNVSYSIDDLPSGIYFAILIAEENKVSAKIILSK